MENNSHCIIAKIQGGPLRPPFLLSLYDFTDNIIKITQEDYMKKLAFTICIILSIMIIEAQAEKITFDDLYSYKRVGDPQFSPDGKQIAFTVTETDLVEETNVSRIWTMKSDGGNMREMTDIIREAWHPRWSPDGKYLAFMSDDETGGQIWLVSTGGGQPRRVTSLWGGASDLLWAQSSDKILFCSTVYPDCDNDSCNRARADEEDNNPVRAKSYDHLLFRHYIGWDDGTLNQLFIYDLAGDSTYQLTSGEYNAPTNILGGYTDYAFSPDGSEVCFVMNTDSIPALSTNNDLFITTSTGGETLRITDNPGQDCNPVYSPDGKYIAYVAQARAGYESDQDELMIYNRENGRNTNLTSEFDRAIGYFVWSPDSKYIYFQAIEHGFNKIWRIDTESREVECLLSDASYKNLAVSPDGRSFITARSQPDQPYELYCLDLKSGKSERLTHFTDEWRERLDLSQADEFWFEGFNGDSIHGFLTLPPDFDSTRKYPLVLLIHGGPQWCWLGNFNYYGWNTQLTAAQGYVTAQIDPHGSTGYGLDFKEYVSGNWGRGDYDDLMIGIDYLAAKYSFIDTTRMAALGRSYGGFMINWINGHTDRFECLITIDGIFSQISSYYSTDELWFSEWEFKGTPWTNREEYLRSSPSTYVENFKTPTLIIHGQKDYRVDVSEAFQMFTALQRRGVPSQLLYFPDEGHSIRKIKNNRHVYQKQFEWLAKWLK